MKNVIKVFYFTVFKLSFIYFYLFLLLSGCNGQNVKEEFSISVIYDSYGINEELFVKPNLEVNLLISVHGDRDIVSVELLENGTPFVIQDMNNTPEVFEAAFSTLSPSQGYYKILDISASDIDGRSIEENIRIYSGELRNVILFIGDGMGFNQIEAAGMYKNGNSGNLTFETFPYQGKVLTSSASSSVTDSAAAATAMATGRKVNNGVISMAYPGDGSELKTILEYFKELGLATGLVTTTVITHATPAAFAAHVPNRNNYSEIASDYFNILPNVLFGGTGDGYGINSLIAAQAGYMVVNDRETLFSLDTEKASMVSGQFGEGHMPYEYDEFTGTNLPHLSEMTEKALAILDNNTFGFFLMVEGGRIDQAGHISNIERNVFETIAFSEAVGRAIEWAEARTDTLIIVTADHETGGLGIIENNGIGNFPTVFWKTTSHTDAKVPIFAKGFNAHLVNGVMENTEVFVLCLSRIEGLYQRVR